MTTQRFNYSSIHAPLAVGDRLGPYEIVAPIGAGGMGEVYRARDTKLDCEVGLFTRPIAIGLAPRLRSWERVSGENLVRAVDIDSNFLEADLWLARSTRVRV